ncbi:dipeptidase PepV [Salipaludibacillus sp. HK11]|uniref:dipeptidase PepV n=1 Tax=Salipaludibacillus sp. HK11 TaxID=3394320 RepID=UPI0039FBFA5A
MNWTNHVDKNKEIIIKNTQEFLQIESVLDEYTASTTAPFGQGIRQAYDWLLDKAQEDGFTVKGLDGYAGHIEWGSGEEIVGILCHIDVVPGGDDWTSPAFAAEIRDDKIFARGAIDDKGPTMACYHALKILKDSNVTLGKRIRLIIGTDEESQWRGVEHYFKHEEMPTVGFAPDADFPIIYAEKGICDVTYRKSLDVKQGLVQSFQSGHRLNMVPERAVTILNSNISKTINEFNLREQLNHFTQKYHCKGELEIANKTFKVTIHGISAHGMEPDDGVNAGLLMARFLLNLPLLDVEKSYFQFLTNYFYNDSRGKSLGLAYRNEELGDLTINVGEMTFQAGLEATIGLNLRYPEGASFESIRSSIDNELMKIGFSGSTLSHERPHAIDKNHELVKTLSKVYEDHTGEEVKLLAIGGGTYARSLKAGVAFGPLFPGQKDVIHQADEFISIDHLLTITSIYTSAMYALAMK